MDVTQFHWISIYANNIVSFIFSDVNSIQLSIHEHFLLKPNLLFQFFFSSKIFDKQNQAKLLFDSMTRILLIFSAVHVVIKYIENSLLIRENLSTELKSKI